MKKFNIVLVAALCASVQMFGMENPKNRVIVLSSSGKVISDTHPERMIILDSSGNVVSNTHPGRVVILDSSGNVVSNTHPERGVILDPSKRRVVILDPSGKVVSDTHPERGTPNIKPNAVLYPEMPGFIEKAETPGSINFYKDRYSTIKK
jgi:hypothetical protein